MAQLLLIIGLNGLIPPFPAFLGVTGSQLVSVFPYNSFDQKSSTSTIWPTFSLAFSILVTMLTPTIIPDHPMMDTVDESEEDMGVTQLKTNKRPWSQTEDTALVGLIDRLGVVGSWPSIALQMENRTGKQCRERYINHLDPLMKKTVWTNEEDSTIKKLHFEIGTKWCKYVEQLPGRSDNAIKNRFHVISRDGYTESVHNTLAGETVAIVIAEPIVNGKYVPETADERIERFRSARELLNLKIEALMLEQEQEERDEKDRDEKHKLSLAAQNIIESSSVNTFGSVYECLVEAVADIHKLRVQKSFDAAIGMALQQDESISTSSSGSPMSPNEGLDHVYSTDLDECHFDTESPRDGFGFNTTAELYPKA